MCSTSGTACSSTRAWRASVLPGRPEAVVRRRGRPDPFPSPAVDVINSYVDTNTHGRIPELIKVLDPNAVFALINTVYLNAKWQTPFDKADTQDAPFTTAAKT